MLPFNITRAAHTEFRVTDPDGNVILIGEPLSM